MPRVSLVLAGIVLSAGGAGAHPPAATYIFPAGGPRGAAVLVKVGGLFLHDRCGCEALGPGIEVSKELKRVPTVWFEGPLLPLPDSQRAEDYPKDMSGVIQIAKDTAPGVRHVRLWTAQGAAPSLKFVIGELPEMVEEEMDGDPLPVAVTLPVTINGRIFPRGDVDVWSFTARRGQSVWCEVSAARIGTALDARLEVRDADGRRLAENDDADGADPRLRFVAPADGLYHLHIHDIQYGGSQAHVYRLTVTSGPIIERVFPLGGRRGDTVDLELAGQGLPAKRAVSIPKDAAPQLPFIHEAEGQRSNTVWLDVDDATEVIERDADVRSDPSGGRPEPRPMTLPTVFNGRIAKAGEVDVWRVAGKKGETFELDLRAGRLGSPLDGIITVHDAAGKVLGRAEASGKELDPTLTLALPADGLYAVHVQDRFKSRGGAAFAYRLRIVKPPAADYRLILATDAVTLLRKDKERARLKVAVERAGGFKDAIALSVEGLPAGVQIEGTTIPEGQNQGELIFKAAPNAKIGPSRLRIAGTAKRQGREVKRIAILPGQRGEAGVDSVLLAVGLPTPFVIKGEYDMGFAARGSLHQRKYKIERNGYQGPIEVSLTDRQARHLQGVTGPTIVVPPDKDEFVYAAMLPPWMETGRTSRTCVMGVGVIKEPDGTEHRVSFSSVNQNEQLVAVVGPGQLALDLERTSVSASAGQTAAVPVRIQRGLKIQGDVKVELIVPAHVRGVSAEPATIAGDRDAGRLVLRFTSPLDGPFNMPLTVRATLIQNGVPFIDEEKLDVRP